MDDSSSQNSHQCIFEDFYEFIFLVPKYVSRHNDLDFQHNSCSKFLVPTSSQFPVDGGRKWRSFMANSAEEQEKFRHIIIFSQFKDTYQ